MLAATVAILRPAPGAQSPILQGAATDSIAFASRVAPAIMARAVEMLFENRHLR